MPLLRTLILLLTAVLLAATAPLAESRGGQPLDRNEPAAIQIHFRDEQRGEVTAVGKSVITARDGGRMVVTDDGRLLIIQPEMLLDVQPLDEPFQPIDTDQMSQRLLDELPDGFGIHRTDHYVIAHNTNPAYVRWVGNLLESLHRGFHSFFKKERWPLEESQFPLVALVFADRQGFDRYAGAELGAGADSMIGYYNLETNRISTFNVPNVERNIATLVHEATHQLAYNTGLQTRFADNPMWVSEGLAIFFESPNFANPKGWQGAGRLNVVNMNRFRQYQRRRPADALLTLLSDDSRFRNPDTAGDAYAEAWALTYFLIRTRKKQYISYLRELSQGQPLVELGRRERVEMFERNLETDLESLDRRFIAFMNRIRY